VRHLRRRRRRARWSVDEERGRPQSGTNPVVVRRTMVLLKEQGFVTSEKGHQGGWA